MESLLAAYRSIGQDDAFKIQGNGPVANSKHEFRNSKQIQISQIRKILHFRTILNLRIFVFVSDFDIRISDFSMSRTRLVPAWPGHAG